MLQQAHLVLVLILAARLAPAQDVPTTSTPSTKPAAFEVVTIKSDTVSRGWRLQPTPDGYTGTNISLYKLVQEAYGIFDTKLVTGGPDWIDRDKFDFEAKFDPSEVTDAKSLSYRERADMLRPVLADRFHLKGHFEKRNFPVYDLVIAKGGPKVTLSDPASSDDHNASVTCRVVQQRSGVTQRRQCLVGSLTDLLRVNTGRSVIDRTGLTKHYDFELRWTPDDTPADSSIAGGPSIFTALQEQLGLKLEPSTAPLDVLVIDSAEKPTAN